MRCARAPPRRSRTACATARPAVSIRSAWVTPEANAAASIARIWSAVTSFMGTTKEQGTRNPEQRMRTSGLYAHLLVCPFARSPSQQPPADEALDEDRLLLVEVDFRVNACDHERERHGVAVSHAHLRRAHLQQFGALLGPPVQVDQGLAAAVRQDLDFTPADAAHTGAERLHHRFLGGEPHCQFM